MRFAFVARREISEKCFAPSRKLIRILERRIVSVSLVFHRSSVPSLRARAHLPCSSSARRVELPRFDPLRDARARNKRVPRAGEETPARMKEERSRNPRSAGKRRNSERERGESRRKKTEGVERAAIRALPRARARASRVSN